MAGKKFGLDLGCENLRVFRAGQGVIAQEKNMIAIKRKKETIAVGDAAYEIYERTPETVAVIKPVRDGVIADIQNLNKIIEAVIRKNQGGKSPIQRGNTFYIAVPSDVTEVEKRAYFDLIAHSAYNTRNIFLVDKPIAAAVGARMNIRANRGMMIVDMGADSTEITVITLGGIVSTKLLRKGGSSINANLIKNISTQYQLLIGNKTAEYIKTELGQAIPGSSRAITIYGRDKISGLPDNLEVTGQYIYECMKPYLTDVFKNIVSILETLPDELSSDIIRDGIYFTGGTAMIPEFDKLVSAVLKIRPIIPEHPENCVVKGLSVIMEDPDDYKRSIISLKEASFG